jgi:hypothetical protein
MAVKGEKAQRLATEVLRQVSPHLPPTAEVVITQSGRFWYFERQQHDTLSASPILSFGTAFPLPRRIGGKLAAIDAVEAVLVLGYRELQESYEQVRKLLAVAADVDGEVVRVFYLRPSDHARMDIAALPLTLL